VSVLQAAMSIKSKEIGERQFRGADYCDEIGYTTLMEIATAQSSYLQCLKWAMGITACNQWFKGWQRTDESCNSKS